MSEPRPMKAAPGLPICPRRAAGTRWAGQGAKACIPGGRCAEVRIGTDTRKRELHHMGAPQNAGARRAQPGYGGAIVGSGGGVCQHHRARCRGLTTYIEQVFDRHRQSGQWQVLCAGLAGALARCSSRCG